MPPKKEREVSLPFSGVEIGAEIFVGSPEWQAMKPSGAAVLEVCLQGASIGLGSEEWFAVLMSEAYAQLDGSFMVVGFIIGSENEHIVEEVEALLADGGVHLCSEDPCTADIPHVVHATRVRWWPVETFEAGYLTPDGKKRLLKARREIEALRKKEEKQKAGEEKKRNAAAKKAARASPRGKDTGDVKFNPGRPAGILKTPQKPLDDWQVIEVSDGEAEAEEIEGGTTGAGADRAQLRKALAATKRRILGGVAPSRTERGAPPGGQQQRPSGRAVAAKGLTSGTNLDPRRATMMPIANLEDSRDTGSSNWMNKIGKKNDMASVLLAQAVQTAEEARRKKKKDKKKSPAEALVKLLTGGKTAKEKKKKKKKKKVKPDPDDPGWGEDESSEEEPSSEDNEEEEEKEEESDSSCEAPLKRRAARRPGSVMEMLVKHAQEQLDQGALLETGNQGSVVTQGVKISTYFGLMIRPYHQGASPLLRELYALAQTIDLLRPGKLPQAADSLAARFISCHTALTDGNWQVASQLEMFPLEATQSASTSTMLKAQKHRRLVMKSQGYAQPWGWTGGGKGRGNYGQEKGKKGDQKGKGRGKNKGKNKEGNWNQGGKTEGNPWKENKEEAGKK